MLQSTTSFSIKTEKLILLYIFTPCIQGNNGIPATTVGFFTVPVAKTVFVIPAEAGIQLFRSEHCLDRDYIVGFCFPQQILYSRFLLTFQRLLKPSRPFHRRYVLWKLALFGFVFSPPKTAKNSHNPLSYRHIRSFCPFVNWVCFFKFATNYHE